MKKRFGDRYDGRRIRKADPTNIIMPFIMKERSDSQVFFDAEVNISKIDELVKEKRKNGMNVRTMDYIMAIIVRTISQYPRMNRFIAGRRCFARDDITVSLAVKRGLNVDSPETTVKFKFEPDSTVNNVTEQIQKLVSETKQEGNENDVDKLLGILNVLPRFLFSFVVNTLMFMDFYGIMPKIIHRISPFHTSVFLTNMGSIGADPIYHHIYNFGTTSVFIAMGNKRKQRVIGKDGKIIERKVMKLRFVADERIADGYYLSVALKYFTNLFEHPELLETPPEKTILDDQI